VTPILDAAIDTPRSVRLIIPGQAEYVRLGRLALSGLVRSRELSAEDLGDLKVALTEACALRRRSPESDAPIEIQYELHDDRLVVELSDDGEGFVIDGNAGQSSGAPALPEPAFGLEIIRLLADEMEVGRRLDGGGSRLRFVKRFAD
jgi:anti-sigma regulatory factor (Ser/Thr protein kinase)